MTPPTITRSMVCGFLVATVVCAAWHRAGGWNPDSLFVDDQWVALACTQLTVGALHDLHTPAPIGFGVVTRWMSALSMDPEWPLQVWPFLCGLVQIPVFYWLVYRCTGRHWAAMFGALLAAGDPLAAEYSVRVKQYVPAQLLATILLTVAVPAFEKARTRDAWLLVGAAALAAVFSFGAILVGLCVVNLLVVRRRTRNFLLPVIVYDLLILGFYLLSLQFNRPPGLQVFWQDHFLSVTWEGLQNFLNLAFVVFPVNAFSRPLCWLLLFLPVGLWSMWRGSIAQRHLALVALALFGGMIFAAAVQVLPIGVPRTEIFAHPLFWLPICCALARLEAGRAVQWGSVLAAAGVFIALPRASYPRVLDREGFVRYAKVLDKDDILLMTSHAALVASYYGDWAVRLVPHEGAGHGFAALPSRPRTHQLPMAFPDGSAHEYPERLATVLAAAVPAGGARRVMYLSTHGYAAVDHFVHQWLGTRGYSMSWQQTLSGRVAIRAYAAGLPAARPR